MVPTGTNLLRPVKHVASIEFGYFGDAFARAHDEPLSWFEPGSGRVGLDRVQVPDRVPVVVPLLVQRRGIGWYGASPTESSSETGHSGCQESDHAGRASPGKLWHE